MELASLTFIFSFTVMVAGHPIITADYNNCGSDCYNCTPCSPGYGVEAPCYRYQPPTCVACVSGSTYSNIESNYGTPCRMVESQTVICQQHAIEAVNTIKGRYCICSPGYSPNFSGLCLKDNPTSSIHSDRVYSVQDHPTEATRPGASRISPSSSVATRHDVSANKTDSNQSVNSKDDGIVNIPPWAIACIVVGSLSLCIVAAVVVFYRRQRRYRDRHPSLDNMSTDDDTAPLANDQDGALAPPPQQETIQHRLVQTVRDLPVSVVEYLARRLMNSQMSELISLLKSFCQVLEVDEVKVLSARSDQSTTLGDRFFEVLCQQHPCKPISSLCNLFVNQGRSDLLLDLKAQVEKTDKELPGDCLLLISSISVSPQLPGGPYCEEDSGPQNECRRDELVIGPKNK